MFFLSSSGLTQCPSQLEGPGTAAILALDDAATVSPNSVSWLELSSFRVPPTTLREEARGDRAASARRLPWALAEAARRRHKEAQALVQGVEAGVVAGVGQRILQENDQLRRDDAGARELAAGLRREAAALRQGNVAIGRLLREGPSRARGSLVAQVGGGSLGLAWPVFRRRGIAIVTVSLMGATLFGLGCLWVHQASHGWERKRPCNEAVVRKVPEDVVRKVPEEPTQERRRLDEQREQQRRLLLRMRLWEEDVSEGRPRP